MKTPSAFPKPPSNQEREALPGVSALSSVAQGLTSHEVAERLRQFGPNVVAQEHSRGTKMFFFKFWGLIPWMLELAVIIEMILGKWVEASVITALLVFNAVIGFLHEGRAQRALALLRQRLTVTLASGGTGTGNCFPQPRSYRTTLFGCASATLSWPIFVSPMAISWWISRC